MFLKCQTSTTLGPRFRFLGVAPDPLVLRSGTSAEHRVLTTTHEVGVGSEGQDGRSDSEIRTQDSKGRTTYDPNL